MLTKYGSNWIEAEGIDRIIYSKDGFAQWTLLSDNKEALSGMIGRRICQMVRVVQGKPQLYTHYRSISGIEHARELSESEIFALGGLDVDGIGWICFYFRGLQSSIVMRSNCGKIRDLNYFLDSRIDFNSSEWLVSCDDPVFSEGV